MWKNSRFLFKFTGKDEEINLLGDGTEKAEFGEWLWISPEQVIELVSDPFRPLKVDLKRLTALTPIILTFIQNLVYRQWISRSPFTGKFYLFSRNIFSSETSHF